MHEFRASACIIIIAVVVVIIIISLSPRPSPLQPLPTARYPLMKKKEATLSQLTTCIWILLSRVGRRRRFRGIAGGIVAHPRRSHWIWFI